MCCTAQENVEVTHIFLPLAPKVKVELKECLLNSEKEWLDG